MTFDVEVRDRAFRVSIEAAGEGRFRVKTTSGEELVSAVATDLGVSLRFESDGRVVDAATTPRESGSWLVQLPHIDLVALVDRQRHQPRSNAIGSAAGEQRVLAPMPGRVVRVLVKAGDEVAARQGLVVVEAMKMENELGSPKAGRVKEVSVAEGASVEAGKLLVVVE